MMAGQTQALGQIRGYTNRHSVFRNSSGNLSNADNDRYYTSLMNGVAESPALTYLLNMGHMSLKDYRSLGQYNALNTAAEVAAARGLEEVTDGSQIALPAPRPPRGKLVDALESRRSTRAFNSATQLTVAEMSSHLKYSFGLALREQHFGEAVVPTRYYPSGGGLYPVTVNLCIERVAGIGRGIYRYQPYSHTLLPIGDDVDITGLLEGDGFDLHHAGGVILYQYDLDRTYLKYGELSLLNILVEVGNMALAFDLTGAALRIGTCQVAGYNRWQAEQALHLDGVNSYVVFAQLFGKMK